MTTQRAVQDVHKDARSPRVSMRLIAKENSRVIGSDGDCRFRRLRCSNLFATSCSGFRGHHGKRASTVQLTGDGYLTEPTSHSVIIQRGMTRQGAVISKIQPLAPICSCVLLGLLLAREVEERGADSCRRRCRRRHHRPRH
jgi:hypothetical protein